jgi:hypothetical protein
MRDDAYYKATLFLEPWRNPRLFFLGGALSVLARRFVQYYQLQQFSGRKVCAF